MKQALYRKYRPTKLSELVGQEEAVSLINNQIENENLGKSPKKQTNSKRKSIKKTKVKRKPKKKP